MPGPLGPAAIFGPGAVAAAKHLAVRAATSPSVTSATMTMIMFVWAFRKLPKWVRDDISFKNFVKNREDLSKDDLFSVIEKLQELASKINELDTEIPQIHAALLAFVQLSGQTKLQQIEYYRSMKKDGGVISMRDRDNCQDLLASSSSTESTSMDSYSSQTSIPTTRDDLYQSAGIPLDLSQVRSIEVRTALKMATFAYYEDSEKLIEKLHGMEYTVLRHKLIDIRPGRVAYYIAVSPTRKQVVIGFRGTSSFGDLVTDCCGNAIPLMEDDSDKGRVEVTAAEPLIVTAGSNDHAMEIISGHERIVLEAHDEEGDNFIRCHEGILMSARNVIDEIEALLLPLVECNYKLVLCGHSLGAGTAIISATLLRTKYPKLFTNPEMMHAFAFGAPPVLDHDSAIAARGYCTTIINNADLISRLNLSNLAVSLACLREIQNKLVENDMNPTEPCYLVSFLNKIAEGTGGTPLMTLSELNEIISEAHDNLELRKPEHLFVPGRVLLVYNPWLEETEYDTNYSGDSITKYLKCVETSGTSPVFQRLEIDGFRGFADHLTSSYFDILGMMYEF